MSFMDRVGSAAKAGVKVGLAGIGLGASVSLVTLLIASGFGIFTSAITLKAILFGALGVGLEGLLIGLFGGFVSENF